MTRWPSSRPRPFRSLPNPNPSHHATWDGTTRRRTIIPKICRADRASEFSADCLIPLAALPACLPPTHNRPFLFSQYVDYSRRMPSAKEAPFFFGPCRQFCVRLEQWYSTYIHVIDVLMYTAGLWPRLRRKHNLKRPTY